MEVQVFGDGTGNIAVLGDRDAALQRRNQKVIEEAPAPGLPSALRGSAPYGGAGPGGVCRLPLGGHVEFVYDPAAPQASFLEVNARLQVEHPVTEMTFGVNLVEQMLWLAGQGPAGVAEFMARRHVPRGHAVEARVYAEDPNKGGQPSPGLVTEARFHAVGPQVRVNAGIKTGLEVSPHYDPMLAKVIAHAGTRDAALDALRGALAQTRVPGVSANLGLLRAVLGRLDVRAAEHCTSTLEGVTDPEPRIEVLVAGALTTVQDSPDSGSATGRSASRRVARWTRSRCARRTSPSATPKGRRRWSAPRPAPRCASPPPRPAASPVPSPAPTSTASRFPAGRRSHPRATLTIGAIPGPGLRTYLAVRGGFDVPTYLGSASTFTLGRFGGHAGRGCEPATCSLPPGVRPPCQPHGKGGETPLSPPSPGEPAQTAGPRAPHLPG